MSRPSTFHIAQRIIWIAQWEAKSAQFRKRAEDHARQQALQAAAFQAAYLEFLDNAPVPPDVSCEAMDIISRARE